MLRDISKAAVGDLAFLEEWRMQKSPYEVFHVVKSEASIDSGRDFAFRLMMSSKALVEGINQENFELASHIREIHPLLVSHPPPAPPSIGAWLTLLSGIELVAGAYVMQADKYFQYERWKNIDWIGDERARTFACTSQGDCNAACIERLFVSHAASPIDELVTMLVPEFYKSDGARRLLEATEFFEGNDAWNSWLSSFPLGADEICREYELSNDARMYLDGLIDLARFAEYEVCRHQAIYREFRVRHSRLVACQISDVGKFRRNSIR